MTMARESLVTHGRSSLSKTPVPFKKTAKRLSMAPKQTTPKDGVSATTWWASMVAEITASAVKIPTFKWRASLQDKTALASSTTVTPPPTSTALASSTVSHDSSTAAPHVAPLVATKVPNPLADTSQHLEKMLQPNSYPNAKRKRKQGLGLEAKKYEKWGKLLALEPMKTSAVVETTSPMEKPMVVVKTDVRPVEEKVIQPTMLTPGFCFYPNEEELISYYLKRKLMNKPVLYDAIGEIDIYKYDPWELEEFSRVKTKDKGYFFYTMLDKKYEIGSRLNRSTKSGYWKTIGNDKEVLSDFKLLGMKKALVFYRDRIPDGSPTNWMMHEYRLADSKSDKYEAPMQSTVLCRVFQKSSIGPLTFMEEQWKDFAGELISKDDIRDASAENDQQEAQPVDKDIVDIKQLPKEALLENFIMQKSDKALNGSSSLYVAQQEVSMTSFLKKQWRQDESGSSSYSREPVRNALLLHSDAVKLQQNMQKQINLLSCEIETLRLNKIANEALIDSLQIRLGLALKEIEEIKKKRL